MHVLRVFARSFFYVRVILCDSSTLFAGYNRQVTTPALWEQHDKGKAALRLWHALERYAAIKHEVFYPAADAVLDAILREDPNVILVGDADMLMDRNWIQQQSLLGQQIAQAFGLDQLRAVRRNRDGPAAHQDGIEPIELQEEVTHGEQTRTFLSVKFPLIDEQTDELYGVGGMFGAMFSFAGDCYAVLSTAKTVGEAKRFCEWIARGYGLDASC